MAQDARFEDGAEKPLQLLAMDAEDLKVIAALAQDAVFPGNELRYQARERRFALLINRFRWEDAPAAKARKRPFERVQSVLMFEDVLRVQSMGVAKGDADMVYALLDISFTPDDTETGGRVELTLAGDGAIALQVEALSARLKDVTRPYIAPSGDMPEHNFEEDQS